MLLLLNGLCGYKMIRKIKIPPDIHPQVTSTVNFPWPSSDKYSLELRAPFISIRCAEMLPYDMFLL